MTPMTMMPKMIWSVAISAWLSVIMWPMPLEAPMSSATITYVQAQPSTMRSVSAISGAAPGISTRRISPRSPTPRV